MDQEYQIVVPFIMSPYCFYAQVLGEVFEEFVVFERSLQSYYEDVRLRSELVLLRKPQLGQMCVAKYAENNQWYRALIKEILDGQSQRHVRVFFVDYGNEEVMPVDGNLLLLNERFRVFPSMAVRCCLDGVRPLDGSNTDDVPIGEIADFMYNSMPEKVPAKFIRKVCFGF